MGCQGCSQGCSKSTACTCGCGQKSIKENCNNCVNQESIAFSGLCDVTKFELDNTTWKEIDVMGTIAVPDEKYSIEDIDSINTNVEILNKKVIETPIGMNLEGQTITGFKLIIEGLLCVGVSYVALVPEQSVHTFHGQIPFSLFIVLPELIPGESYDDVDFLIDACITNVCVKRICERTVDIAACVVLKATKIPGGGCTGGFFDNSGLECSGNVGFSLCKEESCFVDAPVITGVCSPEKVTALLDEGDEIWTEISMPEVLTIPDAKPDVLQILSVVSRIEIMCQKVIATPDLFDDGGEIENYEGKKLTGFKLLIHGLLRQRITYASDTPCKSVHSAHYDVPVCTYIVLPEDTDFTDKFEITSCIEDLYACALNCRQIFKNTTLFFKAVKLDCNNGNEGE